MGFASILAFFNRIRNQAIPPAKGSIYDFNLKTLDGKDLSLGQFSGKKLLIVNTASKCGYTPQLEELQKLQELYADKVRILGFPANDFLWQEPASNSEIAQFCSVNYGVKFPMFEKISVRGKSMHPLFQWLAGKTGNIPTWNFCKYLIDETGERVRFFPSKVKPLDPQIVNLIK